MPNNGRHQVGLKYRSASVKEVHRGIGYNAHRSLVPAGMTGKQKALVPMSALASRLYKLSTIVIPITDDAAWLYGSRVPRYDEADLKLLVMCLVTAKDSFWMYPYWV